MATILEQYRISDFLDWYEQKRLILNPDFQRGPVWSAAARMYLIDTILLELPIPKIYLRTKIDIESKQSIREVVDGQQRLRAIMDFGADRFALSRRSERFAGQRYSTLSPENQEKFLAYPLSVGQLLTADDAEVLEVFSRLNSYSVQLNAAEKRHARFQGEFKWSIKKAAKRWAPLWEECKILTVRERVRMLDDSLVAEMLGIILEGVQDGGQTKIDALYKRHDPEFITTDKSINRLDEVIEYFLNHLAVPLKATPILSAPHFLMLFAALAHALLGILSISATENLQELAAIIDSDTPPPTIPEFWTASKATTHRIASRRVRFPIYYKALVSQTI